MLLVRHLVGEAEHQPVLLIFEDIHWIDPTSHEFLALAIRSIEQSPILAIATFRPGFQPPWTGQLRVTTLTLERLAQKDSASLVRQIEHDAMLLPDDVVQEIVSRSDGVPLFLEEVTRTVLEAVGADAFRPKAGVSTATKLEHAVPVSLQASLIARLDRTRIDCKGDCSGRRRHRAGVLLRNLGCNIATFAGSGEGGSCPAGRGGAGFPARHAPPGYVPVQACSRAGCRLFHTAQGRAPGSACAHCRGASFRERYDRHRARDRRPAHARCRTLYRSDLLLAKGRGAVRPPCQRSRSSKPFSPRLVSSRGATGNQRTPPRRTRDIVTAWSGLDERSWRGGSRSWRSR